MGDVMGDLSSRRGRIEGMEGTQRPDGEGPSSAVKILDTQPTCVHAPRVERRTPCSSTAIGEFNQFHPKGRVKRRVSQHPREPSNETIKERIKEALS